MKRLTFSTDMHVSNGIILDLKKSKITKIVSKIFIAKTFIIN